MKKLSLFFFLLIFTFGIAIAQDDYLVNQQKIDFDLPTEVMVAIEAGNPGLKLVTPPEEVLSMKAKKEIKDEQSFYNRDFKILYKGKNYFKKEMYSREGNLVYLIEQKKNKVLPRLVYNFMGKEFNGWALTENAIVKVVKKSKSGDLDSMYYYLLLQNGNQKQRIFLDSEGNYYKGSRL